MPDRSEAKANSPLGPPIGVTAGVKVADGKGGGVSVAIESITAVGSGREVSVGCTMVAIGAVVEVAAMTGRGVVEGAGEDF